MFSLLIVVEKLFPFVSFIPFVRLSLQPFNQLAPFLSLTSTVLHKLINLSVAFVYVLNEYVVFICQSVSRSVIISPRPTYAFHHFFCLPITISTDFTLKVSLSLLFPLSVWFINKYINHFFKTYSISTQDNWQLFDLYKC